MNWPLLPLREVSFDTDAYLLHISDTHSEKSAPTTPYMVGLFWLYTRPLLPRECTDRCVALLCLHGRALLAHNRALLAHSRALLAHSRALLAHSRALLSRGYTRRCVALPVTWSIICP